MNFSCVYSIQCKDKSIKEFYIGSCKNYRIRNNRHNSNCNNKNVPEYNIKVYQFIRENGGYKNWDMIVEVKTDELTKDERLELEQIHIDLLEPELNSTNARHDIKARKEYMKIQNSKKGNCPYCGVEMLSRHIKRHIGRKHKS